MEIQGLRRERFPRAEGLAKGASVDLGGVSDHHRVPARGTLRLTSQLRRCSASIPANLAEACGRNGDVEFAASAPLPWDRRASWLLLAKDLKLVKPKDHAELSQRATELKRMLTALLQKLTADR